MRTLSGPLLAAQKASSGAPNLTVQVREEVHNTVHLDLAETYSSGNADDEHDAEADANYVYRLRVRGGRTQFERGFTDSWTNLSSDTTCDVCGISVVDDTDVMVVYNRGNSIYFRESTDQGATFGTETLIAAIGVQAAAICVQYKNSSGDLAVFWEQSGAVKGVRRTGGTFGSVSTWTQTANSVNGLDVTYTTAYRLLVSGTDGSDRPTVWTLQYHATADTWSQFFIVIQAEGDEDVTFESPFIHYSSIFRATFVEKFAGTPAYTRTFRSETVAGVLITSGDWEWLDPVPMEATTNNGFAICVEAGGFGTCHYVRPARKLSAALTAVTLDMTADLVEAEVEEVDGLRQRGRFVFDNSGGAYAGPPAPIAIDHEVRIGFGYDAQDSPAPSQSVEGWEYRREGGRSRFVLFTRGADYWLERSRPRTTIQYTAAKPVEVIRGAAARAGLKLFHTGQSARADNFSMAWSVHAHQTSLAALEAVAELLADIYKGLGNGLYVGFTEPAAADAIDYTYGTDHAIYESRTRARVRVSFVEILAEGVIGQAFDFPEMVHVRPLTDRRRDAHATASSDAQDHADARMRKAVMGEDLGELVVPTNCGTEVGDVVAYSDTLVNASQLKARVVGFETRFRRARPGRQPVYEQTLRLGGV